MKHTKKNPNLIIYRPRRPAYPNAADASYFMRKALDVVTAIFSGMGLITAILFLITLA